MNNLAYNYTDDYHDGLSGKVVPVRDFQDVSKTTATNPFIAALLASDEFDDLLMERINGAIFEIVAKNSIKFNEVQDNPFDSIYLCDLQPDQLWSDDIIKLNMISQRIEDRSEEISFDDGWDD